MAWRINAKISPSHSPVKKKNKKIILNSAVVVERASLHISSISV